MGKDRYFCRFRVWLTAILLLSYISSHGVVEGSQLDYYNLVNTLFSDYRAEVRPTNDETATTVQVDFWLLSIHHLDEKNQVLQTSVVFDTAWTDPWLTWTPSSYGNISHFRYPQKKLWLPDMVVDNSVRSQGQLGYDEGPVQIQNDGTIKWLPSEVIETSCDIDVTYYPFDTQVCRIILTTWISRSTQINLDFHPNISGINTDFYSRSGTWELADSQPLSLGDHGGATRLAFTFKLKRRSRFYVLNIIMPVLILSLTSSGVYFLPPEAGEKIGMGMTILLAYAVHLTVISDNMPQTSLQISILSVYMILLLIVTALSVIFSVVILYMHHKPGDEKVGRKTTAVTRKMRELLRLAPDSKKEFGSSSETIKGMNGFHNGKITPSDVSQSNVKIKLEASEKSDDQNKEEIEDENITWQMVANTFDFILFVSSSAFVLLLSVIIMMILVIGGSVQNG